MKIFKNINMVRGWFVGDFNPTTFKTQKCEVAFKKYERGDYEKFHYHKKATEISNIVYGKVKMNGKEFEQGDIIVIEPKEGTDFRALEKTGVVVVKIPGAKNDKYLGKVPKWLKKTE